MDAATLPAPPRIGELSTEDVVAAIDHHADRLATAGVRPGEAVALHTPNEAPWVFGLLALLRVGARPLLVAHDSPQPEIDRLLTTARGRRCLRANESGALTLTGDPGASTGEPGVVLLASSGSTGAPRIVPRSGQSLIDEGRRYVAGGLITPADTLLLPLPMSHAYALGWVAGALLAGAALNPVAPQAFGAMRSALAEGATVLAIVPGLARLLLRRLGSEASAPALRLVMAGAGRVESDLDARWAAEVGVGLARNYGSTETGAVLSGPAGLPSGFVGAAMPGVETLLRDEDGTTVDGPGVGELVVRLEDGTEHPMGDLARRDEAGDHEIIGRRRTNAVRRGARWVSTLEVGGVLGRAYGVADAAVHIGDGRDADDETLVADYVPAGASVTPERVAEYARANLAPYKVPNMFRPRHRLVRGPLGKTQHAAGYRLTSTEVITEALRSEAVLALAELGVLPALAGGRAVPELAAELGLDPEALADLLAAAHELGLLTLGEPAGPVDGAALAAAALADPGSVRSPGLVAAVRGEPIPSTMDITPDPARIAEIRELAAIPPNDDVCLVVDAVHGPAHDLVRLAERLRPGGQLVVADRFTDGAGQVDVALRLRWLATGFRYWWRLADLQAGLESVRLRVSTVTPLADPPATLVIAQLAEPPC